MKFSRIMLIIVVLASFLFVACGQENKPTGPKKVYEPDWYGTQSENDTYLFCYGKADKTNQNMAFSAATANSYAEAANRIEAHVKTMTKNFMSETGVENPEVTALTEQATKVISNQTFNGSTITKRETIELAPNKYQTFVQLAIPKADVNKSLVDKIKKEEALYNRFRASQSFEELDKETNR